MTLHTTPPRNSILAISQLLLTRFWWNLKHRFLGTSRTDSNCQSDICPSNICPGGICPYQQYLGCYWPDLDPTLHKTSWEHIQQITTVTTTFVQTTIVLWIFVHISNVSAVTGPIILLKPNIEPNIEPHIEPQYWI